MSPNASAGPDDFREQVSAWHDGALPDDASRFVLRRLLQDDALRAEVGRWQVIGDALRRRPQQRPSSNLADRIAAALEADHPVAAVVVGRGKASGWREARWWATAAALGLAAVFAWPPGPGGDAAGPAPLAAAALAPAASKVSPVGPDRPVPSPLRVQGETARVSLANVPPLVRAPQPTPEQLAPLPAVDAPGRPWPRSAAGEDGYTVEYRAPTTTPPRQ